MANLKKEHQTLLALTSCLGHAFEIKKLEVAAAAMNIGEKSSASEKVIEEFLSLALKEGYLEGPSGENQQYRWIHDSIQEAALSLIPEDEAIKFKYDVGKSLLQALSGKELDKSLFVVVGLLNPYAHDVGNLSDSEKEVLATLNLAAAKRSMKLSAFVSTCNFAKLGISLLPASRWETHPRLALKLYSIGCEAEAYRMNEKEMKEYASEVLKQESVALFDKMRVYRAQLSFLGLGERNRGKEAVSLCLDILEQLGCTFPKTELMRTAKLISSLMRHKRELSKRTAEEVASLPVLSSRRHREIDSILDELGLYAYTEGQTTLSGLCTMKQTSMTLKYGIHESSYKGFCSLAPFFMVAFGDLKATDQVAQYSRYLKERAHGQKVVSGFCMMQGSFSLPWTHHWTTTIKVLTDGFEGGLRDGELRNANYVSVPCKDGNAMRWIIS
jgi:predicted ATPase